MQRDILLLTEMIDAAEQAHQLTADVTVSELESDRQRRDALLRNRIVHGYWSIDLEVLHTTATEQLPAFTASLRTALDSVSDEPEPEASPDLD